MYSTKNKVKGALFGVAVGDALGAPLEFMSAEKIQREHGTVRNMIGGGWLNVKPGETTDDTQMMLAVANGIIDSPLNPIEPIGARFVQWIQSDPKDIGRTCAMSIRGAMSLSSRPIRPTSNEWLMASYSTHRHTAGKTAGNGSLMRTVYVGLYYQDIADISDNAQFISRMTHYDPITAYDCATYSIMVHNLVNSDADIEDRRKIIPATLDAYFDANTRYDYVQLSDPEYKPNPSGYVVDSFATALHCIFTTSTFEDALIKAVNFGGDADTIGAITGGLAGALYGFEAIPTRWRSTLDFNCARELKTLAEKAVS